MFLRPRRFTTHILLAIWAVVTLAIVFHSTSTVLSALHKEPRHAHSWEKDQIQPMLTSYIDKMRVQLAGAGVGGGLGSGLVSSPLRRSTEGVPEVVEGPELPEVHEQVSAFPVPETEPDALTEAEWALLTAALPEE